MHGRKAPLSAKAASLLADLKAHGGSSSSTAAAGQSSQYIENLVENAAKRRRQAELAFERKLAKDEEEQGAPQMKFVTRGYEERIKQLADSDSVALTTSHFLKGAEKIDSSTAAAPHSSSSIGSKQPAPSAHSHSKVDAEELIRRRNQRRASRLAPQSKVTKEVIEQARERAKRRLGIA